MKQTYIRCPRCELNYILKRDKFCNVCKAEMKALGTLGAEENLDLELCPICKVNYINSDEDICPQCAKEREIEGGGEDSSDEKYNSKWGEYDNREEDEGVFQGEDSDEIEPISNLEDTPLTDDEMDLGISDEEDEAFDEDENSENGDEEDDFDLDADEEDDYVDEDDDLEDDEEDVKPTKKRKK